MSDVEIRSRINDVIYVANDVNKRVDGKTVNRIADLIIHQQLFTYTAEEYYEAIATTLKSNKKIGFSDEDDQNCIRDLLARVQSALDERRPWPELPFTLLHVYRDWPSLQDAPIIGRFPYSMHQITNELRHSFEQATTADGEERYVLLLKLQTGHRVALVSTTLEEPPVYLHSHDHPVITREFFTIYTDIEVEPV